MNPVDPAGRVLLHMVDAEAWLRRARREWRRGARARTLLTLSLAEAEVRVARQEALSAPLPTRRTSAARLAVAAACAALVGILGAGVWSGMQWDDSDGTARGVIARPTEARMLSLGYVPGVVLRLVAPARDALSSDPRPAPLGGRDGVLTPLLVGSDGWTLERGGFGEPSLPWWLPDPGGTETP
ncbi:MAG: hypothetical protein QN163_02740 [Armatimonadota bacterium]|nr:hypothetical protein [Armatimonadota bacterium]MDR5697508.1 hypothetical protein [Armatimonadota bacterium]